ncbi:hypothetical protein [Brevibacillus massiliensis]|uniref:hypothetical protein n=1 Tax=Brevibacillus massiliensis TaxID=1118054 RepID=UPI0002D9AFA4|nr:hypothetical protein [Brevibacillus massiliensis]
MDYKEYFQQQGYNPIAITRMVADTERYVSGLEKSLNRKLSNTEKRKLAWLATWDQETVTVFHRIFAELSDRKSMKSKNQTRYDRER